MMLLFACAASLISGCQAGAMLRQEWHSSLSIDQQGLQLQDQRLNQYPELWYNQQTDHFAQSDERTFPQRYFANFDHFKPGGPIILAIGGEGPLSSSYVSGEGLTTAHFAEKLGGAAVALEHRFYGKSQPFPSLDRPNLEYLTSRQALHDLAGFQMWLKKSNSSFADSTFFCMGGSYPGNLAAWYRLEFPTLTGGCWSASGPVQAQQDWPGFGEKVWKAIATDTTGAYDDSVSLKLYSGYEQLAAIIQDPTPLAEQQLVELFNVCPGTLVSQADRDSLESAISTFPGLVMQYNNTAKPKLADVRNIIIQAETALDAAINVSKFLKLTVGHGPNNCTDNSIGAMYKQLMDATLPESGEGNAGRAWTWQTCNEFGYFQTATSSFENRTMFTRGASARALWQQVCSDVFQISQETIGANVAATNNYYGGKTQQGITNVFYSNGDLDAWSLLSITEYPENQQEVYASVAELGSHCVGLYKPMDGEVPGATEIRDTALQLFQKWNNASAYRQAVIV